ncbi:MAG: A/G-specific adenine glycosylase [Sphingomonadaceae bacterium]
MHVDTQDEFAHRILRWFGSHARALPWRNPPGEALPLDDPQWPYRVWLSEVMLQQTVVATVHPYFDAFTARWPSVDALAAADDADVMAAWAGLGYYARARNLLACARTVSSAHGGHFPRDEATLLTLPGIGAYSAAAIVAFAYGEHAVVVDGNIERIMARIFAVETPLPAAKPTLRARMADVTPPARAGDFAQGLMDLASQICRPKNPDCLICPLIDLCSGKDAPELYPVKGAKGAKPKRQGTAWWIERGGEVLLVRRPEKGLLGDMRALPSCAWHGADAKPPLAAAWTHAGQVTHIFTHFELSLKIMRTTLEMGCMPPLEGEWWDKAGLEAAGLPSLFAKAATIVTGGSPE